MLGGRGAGDWRIYWREVPGGNGAGEAGESRRCWKGVLRREWDRRRGKVGQFQDGCVWMEGDRRSRGIGDNLVKSATVRHLITA